MFGRRITVFASILAMTLIAGCGESDEADTDDDGGDFFVTTEAAGDDECPNGGTIIITGYDTSGDGELDDDEIQETVTICDGADGDDGADGAAGEDGNCADVDPISVEIDLETPDYYRVDTTYTLDITTDADVDSLHPVVIGDAELAALSATADGATTELSFQRPGADELTFVFSDGCTIDFDQFELDAPVYGASYEQLEAGWVHTCGLRTDGSVTCWGADPAIVEGGLELSGHLDTPETDDFTDIQTSALSTCGLHEDNTVTCWGSTLTESFDRAPVQSPSGEFTHFAPGFAMNCGVTTDDSVECFFGPSTTVEFDFDIDDVLDNPAGEFISTAFPSRNDDAIFVLLDTGEVHSVGFSQDQDGNYDFDAERVLDEDDAIYDDLDVGIVNACGIDGIDRGVCYSFDDDEYDRSNTNGATAISAGAYHGCSLFDDGEVLCLGPGIEDAYSGDLDRDETELDVPSDTDFTEDVAAGVLHSCGITEDDLVTCWGEVSDLIDDTSTFFPSVTDPVQ